MNFTDLYRYASTLPTGSISVEALRKRVQDEHQTVQRVDFWECSLDQDVSLGHMVLELERSSPYSDPYIVASVRYDRELNTCWRRFVCCKELMHVFDRSLERTSDNIRFLQLMSELENNPLTVDQSPMFKSERNAEWMALIAMCPSALRNQYKSKYLSQEFSDYDVALRLRIPEVYVKALMGDSYDRSLETLTGEANGEFAKRRPGAG